MNLTEMRQLLDTQGIHLTRSLGQNFLHDSNQLRRIVALAEVQPGDRVLEIGPGLGPLTEQLLLAKAHVLAIEMDARLVKVLQTRLAEYQHPPNDAPSGPQIPASLELLHADALEVVKRRRAWGRWKLVANLPYSVASPILVELALAEVPPDRLVATLQLEVARRLMAGADDDDYGLLSLLVQLSFEPKQLFRVPAACFFPVPDVESACIRLDRRPTELLPAAMRPAFCRVVKRAFSQRRKMMMKLLRADWKPEALEGGFAEIGLSSGIRAEAVSLEQFVRLTAWLAASSRHE